jgi:GAF domain-containing protein
MFLLGLLHIGRLTLSAAFSRINFRLYFMSVPIQESGSPSWTEADRLAALRSFHVLDTEPEAAFDEITASAARICHAPMALVSLVDDVRHWFKCEIGVGEREIPRGIGMCGHTILQSGVFVVPDTTKDPRFADNPLVTGKPASASTRVRH